MTNLRTAAQQALEALEVATNCLDGYYIPRGKTTLPEIEDAIAALRAAMAEPEPCQYPDCVDNGPDGKCIRWLLDECSKSEDYKPQRPAEPQEPDSPERRCGGPGCDMTCCQPGQQGCAHCNHPLYAATKCRVCGRVTKAVQEPDNKADSIRWQLCLLAQTEEFSDEVRNQIARGVWLIDKLRAAPSPAEPVQEPKPVATMTVREDMGADFKFSRPHTLQPGQQFYLYTAPPQRLAEPLTDDLLDDIAVAARRGNLYDVRIVIERALKIREKE